MRLPIVPAHTGPCPVLQERLYHQLHLRWATRRPDRAVMPGRERGPDSRQSSFGPLTVSLCWPHYPKHADDTRDNGRGHRAPGFSTVGLPAARRVELWETHNATALIGLDVQVSQPLIATELNVRLLPVFDRFRVSIASRPELPVAARPMRW